MSTFISASNTHYHERRHLLVQAFQVQAPIEINAALKVRQSRSLGISANLTLNEKNEIKKN